MLFTLTRGLYMKHLVEWLDITYRYTVYGVLVSQLIHCSKPIYIVSNFETGQAEKWLNKGNSINLNLSSRSTFSMISIINYIIHVEFLCERISDIEWWILDSHQDSYYRYYKCMHRLCVVPLLFCNRLVVYMNIILINLDTLYSSLIHMYMYYIKTTKYESKKERLTNIMLRGLREID